MVKYIIECGKKLDFTKKISPNERRKYLPQSMLNEIAKWKPNECSIIDPNRVFLHNNLLDKVEV